MPNIHRDGDVRSMVCSIIPPLGLRLMAGYSRSYASACDDPASHRLPVVTAHTFKSIYFFLRLKSFAIAGEYHAGITGSAAG